MSLDLLFTPLINVGWINTKWNIHSYKPQNQRKYSKPSKDLHEQNKCYGISIYIVGQEAIKPAFIRA